MKCIVCKEREVSNKYFKLCISCNSKRLKDTKKNKSIDSTKIDRSVVKKLKKRVKYIIDIFHKDSRIELDEIFYEKCFNSIKNHKCENCGCKLPTQFRNEEGEVIARWRYSHIIPKSIAPHLRRVLKNINHLCLECHREWENGDKKNMNIYEENVNRFPSFF